MKKSKIDISNLSDIEIYKLVLDNKISRFPRYFWGKPNSLKSAKEITIYLIEKILKWNNEDIKNNLCQETFIDYKLSGMLKQLFNGSPYNALNNAYPNKFKAWELKITPSNYWNRETVYEFIKWLIEEKYKLTDKAIKAIFNKTWASNKGYDCVMDFIEDDTITIINNLYPNKFMPWELQKAGLTLEYWTKENIVKAIKWLVEDKLKYKSSVDIKKKLSKNAFINNGLSGLLYLMEKQNLSKFNLIDMTYPNKYKEWEVVRVIWTDEKKMEAIKWLVEDKLKLDISEDLNKVTANHFRKYKLMGLLKVFNNSPRDAVKFAYKIE